MSLHRGLARVELCRDLFVQQTSHDECPALTFTLRKRFVPPSQLGHIRPLTSSNAVTLNRLLKASRSCWSRNGFVRKSTEPAFRTCTVTGISP